MTSEMWKRKNDSLKIQESCLQFIKSESVYRDIHRFTITDNPKWTVHHWRTASERRRSMRQSRMKFSGTYHGFVFVKCDRIVSAVKAAKAMTGSPDCRISSAPICIALGTDAIYSASPLFSFR